MSNVAILGGKNLWTAFGRIAEGDTGTTCTVISHNSDGTYLVQTPSGNTQRVTSQQALANGQLVLVRDGAVDAVLPSMASGIVSAG